MLLHAAGLYPYVAQPGTSEICRDRQRLACSAEIHQNNRHGQSNAANSTAPPISFHSLKVYHGRFGDLTPS
jgi:hypothetical protein